MQTISFQAVAAALHEQVSRAVLRITACSLATRCGTVDVVNFLKQQVCNRSEVELLLFARRRSIASTSCVIHTVGQVRLHPDTSNAFGISQQLTFSQGLGPVTFLVSSLVQMEEDKQQQTEVKHQHALLANSARQPLTRLYPGLFRSFVARTSEGHLLLCRLRENLQHRESNTGSRLPVMESRTYHDIQEGLQKLSILDERSAAVGNAPDFARSRTFSRRST